MVNHISGSGPPKSSEKFNGIQNSGSSKKSNGKKKHKPSIKGVNAWRDIEDDRNKEEIAKENFENRKLYKVNEKGEKIKEFKKKGVSRPWLDLKFEDNEETAYYDGFFVKRSAVESLDQLRESMELQELDKITIRRKMMKAIRKEKRVLFKEKLYEKKFEQIKSGTYAGSVKVWNKKDKPGKDVKETESKARLSSKAVPKLTGSNVESIESLQSTTAATKLTGSNVQSIESLQSITTGPKVTDRNFDTIEGLDLNYDMGPLPDDDPDMFDAPMDFNGIPYKIIETDLNKLNDQSDSDMEQEPTIMANKSNKTINKEHNSVSTENIIKMKTERDSSKFTNKTEMCQSKIKDSNKFEDKKSTSKISTAPTSNKNKSPKKEMKVALKEEDKTPKPPPVPIPASALVYEENRVMTCVDGFWIRLNTVMEVDRLRVVKRKVIIAARPDNADDCQYLNSEEELVLKGEMRTELNSMANQLNSFLRKLAQKKVNKKPKRLTDKKKTIAGPSKKAKTEAFLNRRGKTHLFGTGVKVDVKDDDDDKRPGRNNNNYANNNDGNNNNDGDDEKSHNRDGYRKYRSDPDNQFYDKAYAIQKRGKFIKDESLPGMVRFDGYWIKKDAAERLKEMKANLKADGVHAERLAELMKVERRREENKESRERGVTCFSCRQTGHRVVDCPLKQNVEGVGKCFKCGSYEHQSSSCTDMTASSFSYATCFICREKGHISRECPKNTRGLYPDGGGCTLCDSNQHLIKDCPRNVNEKRKVRKELTADVMKPGGLLEVDESAPTPDMAGLPSAKNKHIKF